MNSRQWDFLDLISVMSFLIGVANYDENLTQSDKQELMNRVDTATQQTIGEIHNHLREQDAKIDRILEAVCNENSQIH